MIEAVVFDLDGVLLDSERLWDQARREVASEHGGRWGEETTAAMQGMSSPEWATYLRDVVGVRLPQEEIIDLVVEKVLAHYEDHLPLLPGAREAVTRTATRWPLALASSSNRVVIDRVLTLVGLHHAFTVTLSSEEVPRGKPAPDVYMEAARRLGHAAPNCVAVEDSANGIRSGKEAGCKVVAVPNRAYPPPAAVLGMAALVIDNLDELTVAAIEAIDGETDHVVEARLDEEEDESFPASDPHSDWAGPS